MDIEEIIKKLNETYKQSYFILKDYSDYIIKNKIKDVKEIEHCLDMILNNPLKESYELMKEMCLYYSNIDKKASEFYLNEYEKYWEYEPKNIKCKKV